MAMGLGADVTILDRSIDRLQELEMLFGGRMKTIFSTTDAIERYALEADLVVGAVLIPGAAAPRLISRDLVKRMKKGAVMVDVAIDQGGCFETSKPTTHQEPTYIVDDVVHYCVANMPGGVARTSTIALTNATLPYALELADKGAAQAMRENEHLRNGLNVHAGLVTHEAVAQALDYPYVDALTALSDVEALQSV
jgi:alanine dehydrogenase